MMLLVASCTPYLIIPLILLLTSSLNARTVPRSVSRSLLRKAKQLDVVSAWNGRLDTAAIDEYSSTHFTPYYIPVGSISIDDADPTVQYSSQWSKARYPALVNRTMHVSSEAQARAELTFTGIGKQCFTLQVNILMSLDQKVLSGLGHYRPNMELQKFI